MLVDLVIVPSTTKGKPVKSAIIKCWYVMEGDHVHCSCPSPELAELMIKAMQEALTMDKELAKLELLDKERIEEQIEEQLDNLTRGMANACYTDVITNSSWAYKARFFAAHHKNYKDAAKNIKINNPPNIPKNNI